MTTTMHARPAALSDWIRDAVVYAPRLTSPGRGPWRVAELDSCILAICPDCARRMYERGLSSPRKWDGAELDWRGIGECDHGVTCAGCRRRTS